MEAAPSAAFRRPFRGPRNLPLLNEFAEVFRDPWCWFAKDADGPLGPDRGDKPGDGRVTPHRLRGGGPMDDMDRRIAPHHWTDAGPMDDIVELPQDYRLTTAAA